MGFFAANKVTVNLAGELGKSIAEIGEITQAESSAAVVRRAIVIYHTLVKQKMAGNDVVIKVKEGDAVKEVPIFM